MKNLLLLLFACMATHSALGQQQFTRKDSLHGGLRHERTSYDVKRYDLNITVDPSKKYIHGYNDISFRIVDQTSTIQIDLFENMKVDSIVLNGKKQRYNREFNAVFVSFDQPLKKNTNQQLRFYYSGNPIVAKNAPWDGGFVWSADKNGKPWVGVAVQGTGASLWYPVKDSQTDEPENGAAVSVAVPNGLMNVSNGRLVETTDLKNGYTRWKWEVKNPINTYNITVNIGDYIHIHDNHYGLDLDYYVLRGNEEKAKTHFAEVKPMMDCFQSKFGVYPFAEDSYKLVETPYLGMEHQSAVAYGNKFNKGYMGTDLSGTGVGLLFDFITIHESAHEWFGNSITSGDVADMWIHEAFTTYAETVFVECQFGYDKALQYVNGQARNIQNDKPVIGHYGVQSEGSSDMYYKGSLMLNTIRHIIGDDEKWWKILYEFSAAFKHQITDTPTVIRFFNNKSGTDLTAVFDQYLRTTMIPKLRTSINGKNLQYRWENVVAHFNMPIDIRIDGKIIRLYPTLDNQDLNIGTSQPQNVEVLKNHFYIRLN